MRAPTFRTLTYLAYVFSWGALWGFATFGYVLKMADGSENTGMFYVWTLSAFVGSLLIVAKNQTLSDRHLRMRIYLADLAMLAVALILIAILPNALGLVKGLTLLVGFGLYYWWYQKALRAQLWA